MKIAMQFLLAVDLALMVICHCYAAAAFGFCTFLLTFKEQPQ